MEFYKYFLLPLLLALCNCQNQADTCGTLYSEGSQEGRQFHIRDLDQSIDLSEDFRASESGWNTTKSILVQPNCILNACPETFFDGECMELGGGHYSDGNSLNISAIQSASCSCSKACKCSDIYMKRSSCARAYLKGGCKTCHSLYMDLNQGADEFFTREFGNAEAFRIRTGCSLTIYSEEEFQGESKAFVAEVVEDVNESILSYECSCDDEQWAPRVSPPRPDSYPSIVGVPEKLDDIVGLLNTEQFANHIGLKAALESRMHRRSSRNAYILLIGFTGAGKSTTINVLFDNPGITKTGSYHSTTVDITEFRIPILEDELGRNNTELRVIDTPGLGDTRGLQHDAKFLATLDAYLANHEELNDRIPNVVLIFDKFSHRFGGDGSAYVKMLRGLETFRDRITDENYSNVIFVFTHFCSETRVTRRKPEKKLAAFKSVIDNYTLFPKPILMAVAENKAHWYDLPMINGYSKLPNNEYYPRNLYEKLELVTNKGRDPLGQSIFASAFRDSENFNVSYKAYTLLEKDGSSKVEYYFGLLSEAVLGIEKTEISIRLQETWDTKISNALKNYYPYSIQYLQKALILRYIHTKEDIPRTTPAILQLLTDVKRDEATRTLLEIGLGIKPPVFKQNTVAGHGYDVFKDLRLLHRST